MLNNVYYSNLIDLDWEQLTSPNGLYEWRAEVQNRDVLMLNADMCLVIDIDDYFDSVQEDMVTCTIDECPVSEMKSVVEEFVASNQQWLNEFAVVFELMILTGYNVNELEKVIANPWQEFNSAHTFGGLHVDDGNHVGISSKDMGRNTDYFVFIWFLVIIFGGIWLAIGFFIGKCNQNNQTKTLLS